jgi:hypothetical protein
MIGIGNSHSDDPVLDEFESTPPQTDFPVSISASVSVSVGEDGTFWKEIERLIIEGFTLKFETGFNVESRLSSRMILETF